MPINRQDNRRNDHYPRTPPSPPALHDGASVSSALFRLPDLSAYFAFRFRRSGQTTSAAPPGNTTGPPVAAESTVVNIGTLSQLIPVGVALYIADNTRLVVASTTAAAAALAIAIAVADTASADTSTLPISVTASVTAGATSAAAVIATYTLPAPLLPPPPSVIPILSLYLSLYLLPPALPLLLFVIANNNLLTPLPPPPSLISLLMFLLLERERAYALRLTQVQSQPAGIRRPRTHTPTSTVHNALPLQALNDTWQDVEMVPVDLSRPVSDNKEPGPAESDTHTIGEEDMQAESKASPAPTPTPTPAAPIAPVAPVAPIAPTVPTAPAATSGSAPCGVGPPKGPPAVLPPNAPTMRNVCAQSRGFTVKP